MEPSPPPDGELRLRRLRWLCRRGMKELDVLLERFLANHAEALQNGQWPEFEALLANEDDQLWDYVLQPGNCPVENHYRLLRLISSEHHHAISAAD